MIYIYKNPTAEAGGRNILYSFLFFIIIYSTVLFSYIHTQKNVYNTVRSTDYLRDYEVITVRYTYVY